VIITCPSCGDRRILDLPVKVDFMVCPLCGTRFRVSVETMVVPVVSEVKCAVLKCVVCDRIYCPVCEAGNYKPGSFIDPNICPICVENPNHSFSETKPLQPKEK
jgi:hypothetical protein